MAARARAEKGRFMPGNTELDIIPQKWRQEWVLHQNFKEGKGHNNSFKTLCWVPVKENEGSETFKTLEEEEEASSSAAAASHLGERIRSEENKEQKPEIES
ncbi:hypothetical protein T552_00826 [Pneumocystis carinii B80]|uniref:Uncharacterized protein n=1 Tax=Pneumocystis carinii (strain B80) TaxID=1408658 RepID=A0A0W4ZPR4_PNEC8|nr:hypothetical protein T552_00826 [Pneumocystis carinii B80]KTW30353.1 hypothetical protein T552_00826 [Pneumocystis carinii B80]